MRVPEGVRTAKVRKFRGARSLVLSTSTSFARALAGLLGRCPSVHVAGGVDAIRNVMEEGVNVVFVDLDDAPDDFGPALDTIRSYRVALPIVLLGSDSAKAARIAATVGAIEHLVGSPTKDQIEAIVRRAAGTETSARLLADALGAELDSDIVDEGALASLRESVDQAFANLDASLDPIFDPREGCVAGFAARITTREGALATEEALVKAADHVGRLGELRRRVRRLALERWRKERVAASLFVDIDPSELASGDLATERELVSLARSIVLRLAAHGPTLRQIAPASRIRARGFRLAVAGVTPAHVAEMLELAPDFVGLSERLTAGIEHSPGRQRIVASMVERCHELDALAIAERVSSAEGRDALMAAGVDLVQGAIVPRHAVAVRRRSACASAAE